MTRDELLALLLVERFAPRPPRPVPPDDDLTTTRRRRELDAALDGVTTPDTWAQFWQAENRRREESA